MTEANLGPLGQRDVAWSRRYGTMLCSFLMLIGEGMDMETTVEEDSGL